MVDKKSTALLAAIFTVAAGVGMTFAQETGGTAEAPAAGTEAPAEGTAAPEAAPAPAEAPAEAPAAAAPAAEAPAADAPAGEAPAAEANGEPQAGQTYTRETFGDWSMRCVKTDDNKDPCELFQLLRDSEGGAVAETSVVPVEGEVQAIITFVAPLETDLQQGLRLQIDANNPVGYPFMVCARIGCISRVGLNTEELNVFKRGNSGKVTLQPFGVSGDRSVDLTLSLKGFTAGIDAVSKVMADLGGAPVTRSPAEPGAAPAAAPAE